ncbi:MAG: hypothetical protein GY940_40290 [bacterium]|nr:hypothetical protein [bacterium]
MSQKITGEVRFDIDDRGWVDVFVSDKLFSRIQYQGRFISGAYLCEDREYIFIVAFEDDSNQLVADLWRIVGPVKIKTVKFTDNDILTIAIKDKKVVFNMFHGPNLSIPFSAILKDDFNPEKYVG